MLHAEKNFGKQNQQKDKEVNEYYKKIGWKFFRI